MSFFVSSSRALLSRSSLFAPQTLVYHSQRYMGAVAPAPTPEAVSERVMDTLRNYDKVDPTKVTKTSHFVKDLGLDSLDSVEVVMALEDEFCIEIPDDAADNIASVPDAVSFIFTHPHTA